MSLAIFENYSSTSSPSNSKGKMPPLVVELFPLDVINRIASYLKNNHYFNILVNEEYFDIYAERRGFEYSIQAARSDSSSIVSMSVFGEHRRGQTRGELKRLYRDISKLLS